MAQAQQFRALNGQRQSLKLPSNSSHRPTSRSKTKGKMPPVTHRRGLYSVTTSSTLSRSHLIAPELKFPIHTAFAARKAGHGIDIGRRSLAFPVTPPCVRVRTRRFGRITRQLCSTRKESQAIEVSGGHSVRKGFCAAKPPWTPLMPCRAGREVMT